MRTNDESINKKIEKTMQYYKLVEICIPNFIKPISTLSFEGCSVLTNILIPNSVSYIGPFKKCSFIKKITIPPFVTSINENTFDGCSSLKHV